MGSSTTGRPDTVIGLGTLRLVAAAWVALAHGARPPLAEVAVLHPALAPLAALNNALFNGVAAVMLFFVVSGFVIHLPQTSGRDLSVLEHLARRLLRIVPPVLVVHTVAVVAGGEILARFRDILWSVDCEIAYYLAYPLLLAAFRRFGTLRVLLVAFAVSFVVIGFHASTPYYSELPLLPLVVVGLPCWILGCLLAEEHAAGRLSPLGDLRLWRLGAVGLSAVLKVPVTHGPLLVGFPASHWLFAVYAYFWIAQEILGFRRVAPPRLGEIGGEASYSLYLVHFPLILSLQPLLRSALGTRGSMAGDLATAMVWWVFEVAALVAVTGAYHLAIERPFHRVARRLGGWLRDRGAASAAVTAGRR